MTATTVEYLGLLAGACTTFAFIPQVIRVWKTRSASDISYGMYFIYLTGNGLWFAYAFNTRSFPLMITNVVTIILSGSVVFLKVRLERGNSLSDTMGRAGNKERNNLHDVTENGRLGC